MPSLVAFQRKWNIGSDDFVFPEITEAAVRLSWIGFGISVFIYHYPLSCSTHDLTVPVLSLVAINILTVFIAICTVIVSARGTIMNAAPRKYVSTLIYVRCPVFIAEIIIAIFATAYAFRSAAADECHFQTLVRITVVLEWVLIAAVIIGVIAVFHINDDDIEDSAIIASRVWSRRFRIFKIGQDSLMRSAIDDVALLISSFFIDSDLVPSDVVSGLLLLYHSPFNEYPPVLPIANNGYENWMTLENARYFFNYASSVYGWPTYLLYNPKPRPLCRLWRNLQCCGQLRCIQAQEMVVGDNFCFCNTASMVLMNENRNVDLIFMSFRNRVYELPFAVLVDRDKKCVVVTIRGSCSLIDLVTDLCLEDELMTVDVDTDSALRENEELDERGEVRVHRGMLRSARIIFDTLRKKKVLEDLFMLNPGFDLVVCGHSLGAGVASLLAILLKKQWPFVKCFAYSPPGCVISEFGQDEMRRSVMSIVSGDDIVSRISFHAMHRLREKVFKELEDCEKAKHHILIRGVFRLFFKAPWTDIRPDTDTTDRVNLVQSVPVYGGTSTSIRIEPRSDSVPTRLQLYAPGAVLLLSEENEQVTAQWIDPKCLSEVKLSASAMTDHLPPNVDKMFERALANQEDNPSVDVISEPPTGPVYTRQPDSII